MKATPSIALAKGEFDSLAREYRWHTGLALSWVRPDGTLGGGAAPPGAPDDAASREARRLAVAEALRWGEATINTYPGGRVIWAVPIMVNSRLLGGVLSSTPEASIFPGEGRTRKVDVRQACVILQDLVEKRNLTNADLLESRRRLYRQEQLRAEAIHALKLQPAGDLRAAYLREEPMLLAAVRRGNLGEARMRINRLLAAMCYQAGGNLELSKSYFMELAITMCRHAVEAGGDPTDLLGTNYSLVVELARIRTEEELAAWLNHTLEHILHVMQRGGRSTGPAVIASAIQYVEEHLGEAVTRQDVAAVCSLSPTHFSRVFRRHVGRSFVDFLNQRRVDRAVEVLAKTEKPLAYVALEVGFGDQSYFSKVFRRYMGVTPGRYRRARQG